MYLKLIRHRLGMRVLAFSACAAIGCSQGPRTFEELVAAAHKVAASPPAIDGNVGNRYKVSVVGSDADSMTITFEIDEVFGHPDPSRATVAWEFRAGAWRVQSMTTDWSEFGTSSLIAEQAIINAVCRRLDNEYTGPPRDPEANAELLELIGQALQLVGKVEDGDEHTSEAPSATDGDSSRSAQQ